jgi:hypothetical protein
VQTWIFQGNPDQFDLDAYLGTSPTQLSWLVTRYAQRIEVGDRVFIWIAEVTVVAPTMPRPESADAAPFWRDDAEQAVEVLPRALLRLNRVISTREVLRREWLGHDSDLSDLPNLKMAAGTNYSVTPQQAVRLYALWSRTGQDWLRDESVAGLWAYVRTLGTPVSRLTALRCRCTQRFKHHSAFLAHHPYATMASRDAERARARRGQNLNSGNTRGAFKCRNKLPAHAE